MIIRLKLSKVGAEATLWVHLCWSENAMWLTMGAVVLQQAQTTKLTWALSGNWQRYDNIIFSMPDNYNIQSYCMVFMKKCYNSYGRYLLGSEKSMKSYWKSWNLTGNLEITPEILKSRLKWWNITWNLEILLEIPQSCVKSWNLSEIRRETSRIRNLVHWLECTHQLIAACHSPPPFLNPIHGRNASVHCRYTLIKLSLHC